MLSVKEVAQRVKVSEAIVRAWITSGKLPHYRLGAPGRRGKIAVKPEDLETFLASCRVEPNSVNRLNPQRQKTTFQHLKIN